MLQRQRHLLEGSMILGTIMKSQPSLPPEIIWTGQDMDDVWPGEPISNDIGLARG